MEVCSKPVMRKEKKSNPVMKKEKKSNPVMSKEKRREVTVHQAPVHEAPSVDWVLVPSGAPRKRVDGEVVREEPESCPKVSVAPLQEVQHLPEPVQLDLPSRTASTARRCMTSPMSRRGRGPGGPSGELGPSQEAEQVHP